MDYESDQPEDADDMKANGSVPAFKYFGNSDREDAEDENNSCESSCGNDSVAGRND